MQKSELTRAAILAAAEEFFQSHAFRDLTVGKLMTRAGLSRTAFYQYFGDLQEMMKAMLGQVREAILLAIRDWLQAEGDPIPLIKQALSGLVSVCYQHGPFIKALADASTTDEKLEKAWREILTEFDVLVAARIEAQQDQGLIPRFPAYPIAVALNRMDAYVFIHRFGHHPRASDQDTLDALTRVWCLTLYGRT